VNLIVYTTFVRLLPATSKCTPRTSSLRSHWTCHRVWWSWAS